MELILTSDQELNKYIQICIDNMTNWGYTLPKKIRFIVNKKPTGYLGQCVYDYKKLGYIAIKLNPAVISVGYETIMPTIYHEIIHAILPYGVHHGYRWRVIADRVSRLSGYDISRCTSHKEDVRQKYLSLYPYVLKCEKCGKLFGYARKSRIVQNAGRLCSDGTPYCWHATDKGNLIRIK